MKFYGREDQEWDRLTETGRAFLVERARLRRVTSYTELNAAIARRAGMTGVDFAHVDERAAMGHLLGLIVEQDVARTGLMLSALVHYLDANDAGPGLYHLATQLPDQGQVGTCPIRGRAYEPSPQVKPGGALVP